MAEPQLFHDTIFGPVKSRRLGTSLGINLLPNDGKVCTFDCIYCECGYNIQGVGSNKLPSREEVAKRLREKLQEMTLKGEPLDVITFAGNGEPTMHPDFADVIDDTIALRNEYYPSAKVAVLSNSTQLGRKGVLEALLKVDDNILKLDSALQKTINRLNVPVSEVSPRQIIDYLNQFEGNFILQTMFLRGSIGGEVIDNTTEEELLLWLEIVKQLRPRQVMIYTISRPTPHKTLEKISLSDLERIGDRVRSLGIDVQISV